jgi:gliding motility-associated protein GldM
MAGGKETPRQKMIGMMYLVLTALLALNVSKEILNAFVVVNDGLVATTENFEKKTQEYYNQLEGAKNNPKTEEQANKLAPIAAKIKESSDNTVKYIEELKGFLVKEVDGTVDGEDEKGKKVNKVKHMIAIDGKDNYDVPTHLLIGDDPGSPKKGKNTAMELRSKLEGCRDQMIIDLTTYDDQVAGEDGKPVDKHYGWKPGDGENFDNVAIVDQSAAKAIYYGLTLPKEVEEHGEKVPWETGSFDHVPLVACLTIMTSLQAKVRNAEADAMGQLLTKIEGKSFKFNKLEALAIGKSNYLNQGDSMSLKIFMAAYDSLSKPQVFRYVGDSTSREKKDLSVRSGSGRMNIVATDVGTTVIRGEIGVEGPTGTSWEPWSYTYTVGKPTAVISAAELDVLYIGYPNKLEATASGYAEEQIKVSCSGCSVSKSGQFYTAKVTSGKTATVSVSATLEDGSSVKLGQKPFRILPLPKPQPFFGGQSIDKQGIKIGTLRNASLIKAQLPNSPLNVKYAVTSFELVVIKNGEELKLKAKGGRMTPAMKTAVSKIKPGQKVYFENIKAKGPDGRNQGIGNLTFRATR